MPLRDLFRDLLRQRVMPACGVRRIHIIGCARSGTTMMHYAMVAYQGVELCDIESGIRYTPGTLKSISLTARAWMGRQPLIYVTKRNHGWFENKILKPTVEYIKKEKIGVINLCRDPRDVLVSRHRGSQNNNFYVEPERWHSSVKASQYILEKVRNIVPTLNIRYEDVIREPVKIEAQIEDTFDLTKLPGLNSIANLRTNLKTLELPATPWMTDALHNLRDFDDRSIAAWARDEKKQYYINSLLQQKSSISLAMKQFMHRHDYT